jgi:hypothetical protein
MRAEFNEIRQTIQAFPALDGMGTGWTGEPALAGHAEQSAAARA